MITEVSVEDWKPYLKWNIINRNANYLSSDFDQTDFDFYQGFLSGVKENETTLEKNYGHYQWIPWRAYGKIIC